RAHRRTAGELIAAVHHEEGRLMIGAVGEHRADDAQVVGVAAKLGKEIADLDAALSVFLEGEWRLEQRARFALGLSVARGCGLPVVLVEQRLGIERVDLRRTAVEEEEDDVLCLCGEMRRLRSQRVRSRATV